MSYRSRAHVEALLDLWDGVLPVVVVDNAGGVDDLRSLAAARERVRFVDGGGTGFARAANRGAFSSAASYVVFVNPDSRPRVEAVRALVDGLAADPISASHAATMIGADRTVEIGVGGWEPDPVRTAAFAAGLHKRWPHTGLYAKPAPGEALEVDWTTGACMAVRVEQFRRLGGFDESFYVYSEDLSFGRRVRLAGLRQVLRPDVVVPHGAGSSGAPSLEMLRLRGASFANYVARYHAATAWLMRLTLAGGYAARSGHRFLVGERDRSAQFLAQTRGLLTGRAFVGGAEVARRRVRQTGPQGQSLLPEAPGAPLLLVTKEFGLPATSGGMLRTLALARWLSSRAPVVVVHPRGVTGVRRERSGEVVVEDLRAAPSRSRLRDAATLPVYRCLGGPRTCGAALLVGLTETLQRLGPFAAAVVDHTCVHGVAPLLPPSMPVVLSSHNVESDLMAQRARSERGLDRAAARVESILLRRLERTVGRDHPAVVCTPADAERVRADGAPRVVVARNGVTPPAASGRALALAANPEREELLFTGALDWRPNINGLLWLVESRAWADLVAARPHILLTVAGRSPSPEFRARLEAAPRVRVEADVPSMEPLLQRARLGVAPLLEGGGSRIKLLEYVAHGLPSVSTVVGASGLDGLPEGAIEQTAEDPEAFCLAVARQLDTGPLVLSADVVAAMLDRYGWDRALAPVADVLDA